MAPLILPDDILIVDRSIDQVDGRVAVIAFEGELLCKRIFRFRKGVILRSDNPGYQDIRVSNEREAAVWGIGRRIAQRFRKLRISTARDFRDFNNEGLIQKKHPSSAEEYRKSCEGILASNTKKRW